MAALGIALLVAVAGARVAVTHRSSPRADPTPPPSTIATIPIGLPPGPPDLGKDELAFCPLAITCRAVRALPAGVLQAVRRYLPDAGSMSGYTVLQVAPSRVHYRQVNVAGEGVSVVIRVSRAPAAQADPTEQTNATGAASTGYVRVAISGGYEVQVQFIGRPGSTPPMAQIRALAADPRLLAVG